MWALGCFLHSLLTSDSAFKGANFRAQLFAVCNRPPPSLPVSVRMSAHGKEISAMQLMLLSKDPKKRPMIADVLKTAFVQDSIKYLVAQTKAQEVSGTTPMLSNVGGRDELHDGQAREQARDPRFLAPAESRRALERAIRREDARRKAAAEAESRRLLAERAAKTATHSMREKKAMRERQRALIQVAENHAAAAKTKEKVKAMEERNSEMFKPAALGHKPVSTAEELLRKRERDRRLKMENRRKEIERAHEIARQDRLMLQQRLLGRQERGTFGSGMPVARVGEAQTTGNQRNNGVVRSAEIRRYFRQSQQS